MDPLLRPWLARLDALLAPSWRLAFCGGDAIPLPITPSTELREALELLAHALWVEWAEATALVSSGGYGDGGGRHHCQEEDRVRGVRLRLEVEDGWRGAEFSRDWSDETASAGFLATKAALEQLGRVPVDGPRFGVELAFRVSRLSQGDMETSLRGMVDLLERLDRRVFDVTQITVHVATVQDGAFAALMGAVMLYTDTADVVVHIQLSSGPLLDWKRVLDATLRTRQPRATRHKWDVVVSMDDPTTEHPTDARVVAACFSALAHAGGHVTSIELRNPLGASHDKDLYRPTDRRIRAKWLGYLLRLGAVSKVVVHDTTLSQSDMDMIASTLQAPSEKSCLYALWEDHWHINGVEHKPQCDDEVLEVRDTGPFPESDIVGVMRTFDDSEHAVDVLVVGYGQCTVPRAYLTATTHFRVPAEMPGVKSLQVSLSQGEGTEGHLLRLVMLLGKDLEELDIDAVHSQIALSVLIILLASCPRLQRLSVKSIYLNEGDDEQLYLPTHWANHPLEELSVTIHLNEASVGLCGLASVLMLFGVQLKVLRILAEPPMATNQAARSSIQTMLRTCCKSLHTLEVVGLSFEYFQDILAPDALGLDQLGMLVLSDTAPDTLEWPGLMRTLALPNHPLTQSLRSLRMYVESARDVTGVLAKMLAANAMLVDCQLTFRDNASPPKSLFETDGRALRRRKAPLSLRQKIAFLSCVQNSVLPWESSVLGTIFMLAAPTETRRVIVSTQ